VIPKDCKRLAEVDFPIAIVRTLVEAGIMREEGEGIPRMFDEMERALLPRPEFEVSHGVSRVRLKNNPVFETADPRWKALVERLPLTPAQKRVLLAHPRGFTNER